MKETEAEQSWRRLQGAKPRLPGVGGSVAQREPFLCNSGCPSHRKLFVRKDYIYTHLDYISYYIYNKVHIL